MTLTIFLLSPSTRAICPASRRVTENRLGRSRSLSCFFGRSSGFTSTFHDSRISGMPHSGGCGGVCWMYLAIRVIWSLLSSPELPQFGMPSGVP